ncbi:uncharacterized protein METZ01_LOCUS476515 [marine metagenome]|uniref:DUF5681 domain-containing protein n=1 Tax=marine metagenome TaxID=408172 RepID=A0A383BUU6_9ZZZZ
MDDSRKKGNKNNGENDDSSFTAEKHKHGKHPNSLANLKPYEKGVSGNPGGRSMKFKNLKTALDRWGEKYIDYDLWEIPSATDGESLKEQVIFAIWDKARRGNVRCIEILAQLGCLDD